MRLRHMLVPLSVLALVTAAPGAANAVADPPITSWPQFMLNSQHTGFNSTERAINPSTVNNLGLDFVALGPADPEFGAFRRSAPAVVNGVAYLGDAIGNLVAFPAEGCKAETCDPLWTARLSNDVSSSPAVDNGIVFVATAGNAENGLGQLYAFLAAGCGATVCRPLWVAQVPNTDSSPVTANGVVYIAASDGTLRAFAEKGCGRPACGPLWTGPIGTSADASPAVDKGIVYVTSGDGLFAFRAAGCGQARCPALWRSVPADGIVQEVGPTVSNGHVYFASSNFTDGGTGSVYSFAAAGCGSAVCKPEWTAHPAPEDNVAATMAVAGGVLYASTSGALYAFDANGCGQAECSFLWLGFLNGFLSGTSASPTVAGGLVFFPQDNGDIGAFAAKGCGDIVCSQVWFTNTQPFDALLNTPVILDGRLYVSGPRAGDRSAMYVYSLPPGGTS
jgi:hypothetical protein